MRIHCHYIYVVEGRRNLKNIMSHTITLELPDSVFELLQQESQRKGKSPEDTIVEKIAAPSLQKKRTHDPFFADSAIYEGDAPADGSLNHDKYLYDERL